MSGAARGRSLLRRTARRSDAAAARGSGPGTSGCAPGRVARAERRRPLAHPVELAREDQRVVAGPPGQRAEPRRAVRSCPGRASGAVLGTPWGRRGALEPRPGRPAGALGGGTRPARGNAVLAMPVGLTRHRTVAAPAGRPAARPSAAAWRDRWERLILLMVPAEVFPVQRPPQDPRRIERLRRRPPARRASITSIYACVAVAAGSAGCRPKGCGRARARVRPGRGRAASGTAVAPGPPPR